MIFSSLLILIAIPVISLGQLNGQRSSSRSQNFPRFLTRQQFRRSEAPSLGKPSIRPQGRILEPPVPQLCANREIHDSFENKGYWFSWKDSQNIRERDWLDGRNYCRRRCMDLVSIETSTENEFIKKKVVEGRQKYIWTSGRLCDFKGCESRQDLKPIAVNGWFWSGVLKKLAPVTNRQQNDWSSSGGLKKPQPDNREFLQGGAPETCLAILNNFYGDGIHWHDVACHHLKPIVCEDSEALLKYVRSTNPGLQV